MNEVKPEQSAGVPVKQGDVFPSLAEFMDKVTPLLQSGGHKIEHFWASIYNRNIFFVHCRRRTSDSSCECVTGASHLQGFDGAVQCVGISLRHSDACVRLQMEENAEASKAAAASKSESADISRLSGSRALNEIFDAAKSSFMPPELSAPIPIHSTPFLTQSHHFPATFLSSPIAGQPDAKNHPNSLVHALEAQSVQARPISKLSPPLSAKRQGLPDVQSSETSHPFTASRATANYNTQVDRDPRTAARQQRAAFDKASPRLNAPDIRTSAYQAHSSVTSHQAASHDYPQQRPPLRPPSALNTSTFQRDAALAIKQSHMTLSALDGSSTAQQRHRLPVAYAPSGQTPANDGTKGISPNGLTMAHTASTLPLPSQNKASLAKAARPNVIVAQHTPVAASSAPLESQDDRLNRHTPQRQDVKSTAGPRAAPNKTPILPNHDRSDSSSETDDHTSDDTYDDDAMQLACASDIERDDEPISPVPTRSRRPTVNQAFPNSEAFMKRVKDWTASTGHSVWVKHQDTLRTGHSGWVNNQDTACIVMVCANHRASPIIAAKQGQKNRGTQCGYTVTAEHSGSKWKITKVNLVHNKECKAIVAAEVDKRRSSTSTSSKITKAALKSPAPVRAVASNPRTRNLRVAESEDEEEEEAGSSSKKQKVQHVQPAASSNDARMGSAESTASPSLAVTAPLRATPAVTPIVASPFTPIPLLPSPAKVEKPVPRVATTAPSPSNPSPGLVRETDQTSSKKTSSSDNSASNSPSASSITDTSMMPVVNPGADHVALRAQATADPAMADLEVSASMASDSPAEAATTSMTSQTAASEAVIVHTTNEHMDIDHVDTPQNPPSSATSMVETAPVVAALSLQTDLVPDSVPEKQQDAAIPTVSVAEIASAMSMATAASGTISELPDTSIVASVLPPQSMAVSTSVSHAAVQGAAPAEQSSTSISISGAIHSEKLPTPIVVADISRNPGADVSVVEKTVPKPVLQTSQIVAPLTPPPSPTISLAPAMAVAPTIPTVAPVMVAVAHSTNRPSSATTEEAPLHSGAPIQEASPVALVAAITIPAATPAPAPASVQAVEVSVPTALIPIPPPAYVELEAPASVQAVAPTAAAPALTQDVTMPLAGDDLPVEVHDWRAFLHANGIDTATKLRAKFYKKGIFKPLAVKSWLAWVAEDPKTALSSLSEGWDFMTALQDYFAENA